MRLTHFERLKPLCPQCREGSPLDVRFVLREEQETVFEGILVCSNSQCRCEYPIIDGIPIIVADVRTYVSQGILPIIARTDLSDTMESLLGDCSGPGSSFDVQRQHLSTYAFDHYGDLDPQETGNAPISPGSVMREE